MTDNIFVDPLPNQDMTVSTDKADYAPGETVKITAGGFAKGSTITFAIADDPSDFGDDGDRDFYTLSPNPITDGGVGDLDGNANGEVVTTWFVPTDNNGTGSGTPDALNGTLILTATGSDGQMATTMFMDAVQTDYRGWENIVSAGVEWANGGINQGQGLYLEGDYVPHAVYFKGLTVGTTYTFEISFNAYQATSNAGGYVAIGTYNQSVQPTLLFPASSGGPLVDTTPMTGTGTSGFFYTSDFNNNSMNDADVTSVGNVFINSGTISSSDVEERALVTFTATNSDATIYYGLRLALPGEVAPGTQGADGFTGLSLQSSVKNGPTGPAIGGGGNVQLAPGAVTQGSISGYKWNDADGSTTLNGTESKLPGWEIQLYKDDGDGIFEPVTASSGTTADTLVGTRTTDASGNYMFSGATGTSVIRGTYFIREVLQLGWTATTPTTPTSPDNGLGYYTATINETTPIITTFNFGNRQLNPNFIITKTAVITPTDADGNIDSPSDDILYTVKVTNTGNQTLTNVVVTDPLAVTATNPSGQIGTIASFAPNASQDFTFIYDVTQAIIDSNGGGVDNTATADSNETNPVSASATVPITQSPALTIAKTAVITPTDADGNIDSPSDDILYTVKVTNTGNQTLTNVVVTDPLAVTATNPSGQIGTIASFAPNASQDFTFTYDVTQAIIDSNGGGDGDVDNTATADSNETNPVSASATVPILLNPVIKVTKSNDGVADTNCDGKENAGDQIVYNYAVKNDGNVSLFNVTANDNQLGNITLTGLTDLDRDNTADDLAVGITATGTATATLTQAQIDGGSITNIALAKGEPLIGDPVTGTDTNTVNLTRTGDLKITKTDYLTKVVPGQCVTYTIVVSNCGPDTATHALVEDLFPSNLTDVKWTSKAAKGATDNKARGTDNIEDYVTLPAGSSITYKVTGTVVGGPASHKVSDCHRTLTNTATVTAPSDFTDTNLENNTATDIDTIMAAPGVHNAHFWQNTKWQKSWDGIQGNEHSQKTRPNFPDSDLLLSPYTNSARSGKVLDPITRRYGVGLLIGDYNHNGKTDKKENTLFYTRAQALQIVDSSMHPNNRDTRYILGRDLVTSWLNYLAGNSIDTPNSKDQDARDYINEGIHWLQALTPDQNRDGKGDGYLQGLTGNETSNSRTPQILARSSYWKSGISSASNLPNSYKSNTDVLYPIDAGITIHTHLDNYNNNIF